MRLVIIGAGYSAAAIGAALAPWAASIHATARSEERLAELRRMGWEASLFDGERQAPALISALASASHLLVSAPPTLAGDPVLIGLGAALEQAPRLERVLYLSTIGVYGNHDGAIIDESAPLRASSPRTRQRIEVEAAWQAFCAAHGIALGIFRLAGIYGPGRSAIDNLRAGTARRLIKPGQVFNRIHRADIAGAGALALRGEGELGIFNVSDDEPAPPQDVVAFAANLLGLPVPPDIPFESAELSEMARSFYGENKRVSNAKLKATLGYPLRFPTYREGLRDCL